MLGDNGWERLHQPGKVGWPHAPHPSSDSAPNQKRPGKAFKLLTVFLPFFILFSKQTEPYPCLKDSWQGSAASTLASPGTGLNYPTVQDVRD